jgi:hypothetical protein
MISISPSAFSSNESMVLWSRGSLYDGMTTESILGLYTTPPQIFKAVYQFVFQE